MKQLLFFLVSLLFFISCKPSDGRHPISTNSGSFIDASIERNKQLNEFEYARIESFIAASKTVFTPSEYGFWYRYTTKIDQDAQTPAFGDMVMYTYDVKTLHGRVIYTKEDLKTQTYYIDQQELFTGLREGLKLMKEGESVTFIFPSQQAYGYYGDHNQIGSNLPLVCEVSLLKLTKN